MKNQIWLALAFIFMMVVTPMLMLLTISVNSTLSMAQALWIGTPALMFSSVLLAIWYLRHSDQSVRYRYVKNGGPEKPL